MTVNLADLTEEQVGEWLTKISYEQGYEDEWEEESPCIDFSAISELPTWRDPLETPIGIVKEVDEYGGEGQGDQYWKIYSVTQGETVRSFKLDGWYASYDGGYYDEFYEVKPELKTITVWEKA